MNDQPTPRDIIILSLGPVQSFIETARRTQDLAVGSGLLSLLARAALDRAIALGAEEVFPVRANGRWPVSIPNRMVATTPAGEGKAIAEAMASAAQRRWNGSDPKGIAVQVRDAFSRLAINARSDAWRARWDEQIGEWLETYWVVWPWDGQPMTYSSAYRQASLALEARKNARFYPTGRQPGEKCILCGVRSALGTEEHLWQYVRQQTRPSQLRRGERLCAVCACKRFAARSVNELARERFPSTSSIASASFRAALLQNWEQVASVVAEHLDAIDQLGLPRYEMPEPGAHLSDLAKDNSARIRLLHYDGDCLYHEFLTEAQIADALGIPGLTERQRNQLVKANATLRVLRRKATELGIPPPPAYYAALAMDGDHMGELLNSAGDLSDHQLISSALARLATDIMPPIVEKQCPGQLVYAGGDDVLALLPVDRALHVAAELRAAFTRMMDTAGFSERTASAGLAIVHHLSPLDGALRAARAAEVSAKDDYGRNAVAVTCLRRSGEERVVGRHWLPGDLTAEQDPLDEVRNRIAGEQLSGKFAYEVAEEAGALTGIPDAHVAEIARLLKRHVNRKRWKTAEGKTIEAEVLSLASRLADLADMLSQPGGQSGIVQLGEWLILARFLAQGEQP